MGDHHDPDGEWVTLAVCGGALLLLMLGAMLWAGLSIYM